MKRSEIIGKLSPFSHETYISHALETLSESDDDHVSNEDVGCVWEHVSKSLDQTFSDDDDHPLWDVEELLSKSYKYPNGKTGFEVIRKLHRNHLYRR